MIQRTWPAVAVVAIAFADTLPEFLQQPGTQHFYNLEFDDALAEALARVKREPESPAAHNVVAQTLIFRALYRAGALDTGLVGSDNAFFRRPATPIAPEDEKLFLDSLGRSMSLAQSRVDRDKKDIAATYSLGAAYGIRANYNFSVKKAYIAALRDIAQARKLHTRVSELNPNRADARLIPGLHTYVAGSLPFPWKQVGFFAGLRGDKESGIRLLRQVADSRESNSPDAAVFLAAIYRREHRPAEGIPLVEQLINWFPRNYLFRFELARLYADSGNRTRAQAIVSEIEQLRKTAAPGFQGVPEERFKLLKEEIAKAK